MISFALGDPGDLIKQVHDVGSLVMLQVTTVAQAVAARAPALGRLDPLAFAGGVGEPRSAVREADAGRLRFLGEFTVDAVPAREDVRIARQARATLDQ